MATFEMDADAVNKVVASAILDSTLGTHLRAIAEKQLQELRSGYKNPIEDAIRSEVYKVVETLVREEFRPKIEAIVRERITDEVISVCTDAAWTSLQNAISKARY